MFGCGLTSCSLPLCSQTMMLPYDVPVRQPYPSPVPVPQPYTQNFVQPVDVPVQHTIQPVICPTPFAVPVPSPVPVPVDRPCAVPVPQPVPFPVDRPCAVPVPVHVPFPQPVHIPVDRPCAVPVPVHVPVPQPVHIPIDRPYPVPVPQPFPVPVPVEAPIQVQQEYYPSSSYRQVEYIIEKPVRIVRRCRHRRRRCRSYSSARAPLPPIVIPIPIQAPVVAQQQPQAYQVTEYVQDIYPPAQVYTEQVPMGYVVKDSAIQEPGLIQNQQTSFDSKPGVILPSASYAAPPVRVQQRIVQQLPNGQLVQRPLTVGGGGIQNMILQQPGISQSNSTALFSTPSFGTQFSS